MIKKKIRENDFPSCGGGDIELKITISYSSFTPSLETSWLPNLAVRNGNML